MNRTRPWKTSEADEILTSRLATSEASTPVVTRSDRPCLSSCRVSFLTSSVTSRSGLSSSPLTDDAVEAFLDAARDDSFEAAVFLGSLPSAARLA